MTNSPTSFRLSKECLRRLDLLAEHLRTVLNTPAANRTTAMSYLIMKTLDETGTPTWEALGVEMPFDPDEIDAPAE